MGDQYEAPWGVAVNSLTDSGPSPAEFKGDFRNGFLDFGWDRFTPEQKIQKRTIELNNGRAAMCGILGLMVHDKLGNLGDILPGQEWERLLDLSRSRAPRRTVHMRCAKSERREREPT